ncbi:MAG: ketoacyl-ACP synthase III [Planctomycetes bacterium]|nr:ketoacyl-ACP synthase III [Planctomycetota bacterium]
MRGLGRHLPERQLTNKDLEKLVDTSDEWIAQRTGIRSRRVLPDDWITSDLAAAAGERAIADAGIDRSDIDLLIVATVTPDHLCPSTACVVQRKLGLTGIPAFDISVACSGFGYGLSIAAGMIKSGLHRNVLVIGAEAMTRFMNYEDRGVCILFGDGAGAAVCSKDGRYDVLYTDNGADGSMADMIEIPGGGSREPASPETLEKRRHFVILRGREVFKSAVRQMSLSTVEGMAALGLEPTDLDWMVPHQANARIIEAVGEQLGLPPERVIVDLEDKGNTTAASIPIALCGLHEASALTPGQLIALVGFGAGAAWSCQILRVRG